MEAAASASTNPHRTTPPPRRLHRRGDENQGDTRTMSGRWCTGGSRMAAESQKKNEDDAGDQGGAATPSRCGGRKPTRRGAQPALPPSSCLHVCFPLFFSCFPLQSPPPSLLVALPVHGRSRLSRSVHRCHAACGRVCLSACVCVCLWGVSRNARLALSLFVSSLPFFF